MAASDQTIIAPHWEAVLREHGLGSTADVYACARGAVRARSGTSEVRRLTLDQEGRSHEIYLKKYWFNGWSRRVRPMFRGTFFGRSKVRREFENLAWLRDHGLMAPEPVAWGEERKGGWLTRSWLMSAAVPSALGLDSLVAHDLPARPAGEQRVWRRQLIDALASSIRRMHDQGFVHHDLFWRNIILSGRSLDRFFLIDAHKGGVRRGRRHEKGRAADLACLDSAAPGFFSRTERLRFLLGYLNTCSLHPSDRPWVRRILRMAEPLRERQHRRVVQSPRPHGGAPHD